MYRKSLQVIMTAVCTLSISDRLSAYICDPTACWCENNGENHTVGWECWTVGDFAYSIKQYGQGTAARDTCLKDCAPQCDGPGCPPGTSLKKRK